MHFHLGVYRFCSADSGASFSVTQNSRMQKSAMNDCEAVKRAQHRAFLNPYFALHSSHKQQHIFTECRKRERSLMASSKYETFEIRRIADTNRSGHWNHRVIQFALRRTAMSPKSWNWLVGVARDRIIPCNEYIIQTRWPQNGKLTREASFIMFNHARYTTGLVQQRCQGLSIAKLVQEAL